MGLDITVYTDAVPTTEDDENGIVCRNETCFESRRGDMEEGTYLAEEFDCFRGGSYGGYNAWRDELCKAVHGIPAQVFWDDFPNTADIAFAELINFSDCEGFIGTSVCKKLADDFEKCKDKLAAITDDYWQDRAEHWRDGFQVAGENNGFVYFH